MGCATQSSTEAPITPTKPALDQPIATTSPVTQAKPSSTKGMGTPMGGAVHAMRNAEKEILEAMRLINAAQGDRVLDCQNQRQESFQLMQEFFGAHCFGYDDEQFWFLAPNGQKIKLNENDGELQKTKIGFLTSLKELVAYQVDGGILVETDFYMDCTKGELIIHHYRDGERGLVETFNLAGY